MWGYQGPNPIEMVRGPSPAYPLPPELGGEVGNVGVQTSFWVRNGAAKEIRAGVATASLDDWSDNRSYLNSWTFDGNAWTIQLTMRPGLYVPPDILAELGSWDDFASGGTAPYA